MAEVPLLTDEQRRFPMFVRVYFKGTIKEFCCRIVKLYVILHNN